MSLTSVVHKFSTKVHHVTTSPRKRKHETWCRYMLSSNVAWLSILMSSSSPRVFLMFFVSVKNPQLLGLWGLFGVISPIRIRWWLLRHGAFGMKVTSWQQQQEFLEDLRAARSLKSAFGGGTTSSVARGCFFLGGYSDIHDCNLWTPFVPLKKWRF